MVFSDDFLHFLKIKIFFLFTKTILGIFREKLISKPLYSELNSWTII